MKEKRSYDVETLKKLHQTEIMMLHDFDSFCMEHNIHYFAIAGTAIGTLRHHGMIPWDDDIDIGMLRADYEKFAHLAPKKLAPKYRFYGPDFKHKYYNFVPNMSLRGTKFVVELAEGNFSPGIFMDLFVYENIPETDKEAERQIRECAFWRNLYVLSNIDYFHFLIGNNLKIRCRYILCGLIYRLLRTVPNVQRRLYWHYKRAAMRYNGDTERYTILGDPYARKCIMKKDDIFPIRRVPFEDGEICIANKCEDMLKRRFGDYMTMPPENRRVNHCPVELDFGSY